MTYDGNCAMISFNFPHFSDLIFSLELNSNEFFVQMNEEFIKVTKRFQLKINQFSSFDDSIYDYYCKTIALKYYTNIPVIIYYSVFCTYYTINIYTYLYRYQYLYSTTVYTLPFSPFLSLYTKNTKQ